jgi:hypothetical protein
MHIHGNSMNNFDMLSVSSSAAARNSLDKERAAQVRKKLAKGASTLDAAAEGDSFADLWTSQWNQQGADASHVEGLGEDHYTGTAPAYDPDKF